MNHNSIICDVTVLGGLPLQAEFYYYPPDPRDLPWVAPRGSIEDLRLLDRNGRVADWAEDRLDKKGWDDLEQQCWDHLDELAAENAADYADYVYESRRDRMMMGGV